MKFGGLKLIVRRQSAFIKIFVVLLLSIGILGCATKPPEIPEYNYFSCFSKDNDTYFFIPVQNNKDFVRQAFISFLPDMDSSDIEKILDRTSALYYAKKTPDNLSKKQNFQLIVSGNFPILFVKSSLKKKNGWTKQDGYYSHTSGMNICFSSDGTLNISTDNPLEISNINMNDVKIDISDTNICFLLNKPFAFLQSLFGEITFPIKNIRGKMSNDDSLSFVISFSDKRAVKPAMLLFKFAKIAISITQNSENEITVSGVRFSKKRMEELWF